VVDFCHRRHRQPHCHCPCHRSRGLLLCFRRPLARF
jgi:hypothetical protein